MRVAIHQPNYVPWAGYFFKMACADTFVFLDDAQFTKNGFVNRNRIKTDRGPHWLTVPAAPPLGTPIDRTRPAIDDWPDRHLKTLQTYYAKAPHFATYRDGIAEILQAPHDSLAALNMALVARICEWLGIRTPCVRASTLAVDGVSDVRLARLTRACGGTEYLSGFGGAHYQARDTFTAHGVALATYSFRSPIHPQLHGAFVPDLSILDMLFNCGAETLAIVRAASQQASDAR